MVMLLSFTHEKWELPKYMRRAGRIGMGSVDLAYAEASKPVPSLHDQLDCEVEVWHPKPKDS